MSAEMHADHIDGIAVIGMSGRFPGAPDIPAFWANLCAGKESVKKFTDEELLAAGEDRERLKSPAYVRSGILLEGADLFDADFFGFTPREAEITNPEARILFECAWEALESAGYNPDSYSGRIGVFAGSGMHNSYRSLLFADADLAALLPELQRYIAVEKDFLATSLSYHLNLRGPSITVQTACSTSLVAVHLACQSLLNGDSDMVLAGGSHVRIPQIAGYLYQDGLIRSPDGHCRAFDAAAKGTAWGSGAGVVLLKRLADALTDGDCIRAIIRSSCINNDGAVKIGYTAPSEDGQAAVIGDAQALAGVTGHDVTYVETHGTGTLLGDPIEIAALTQAFRRTTSRKSFCAIGSLKTNVGHLDAAAGIGGLIKVVLALENRMLPPSLNFSRPNPAIDFANSPFFVQQTLSQWMPESGRRIAGVSSFGIGGTNAHAVLEEAPAPESPSASRPQQLLVMSARSATALDRTTQNLCEHLKKNGASNLADVAYTLQTGRKAFAHRRMLVCQSVEDAIAGLEDRDQANRMVSHYQEAAPGSVVFMFPGQGSQYANMSRELYDTEAVFRHNVDRCCRVLQSCLSLDLREVLYPGESGTAAASERLEQTLLAQPALFVIEYALAKLMMSWGVKPAALVGHSVGEYVAACLAGVFSLEDALRLVSARGQLMQSLPRGSMLAVSSPESEVTPLLTRDLCLAAVNGPSLCVVSGETESVKALEAELSRNGITTRHLHTSHAFHSRMMEPIISAFGRKAEQIAFRTPAIPIISTVTGSWVTPSEMTVPVYWTRNLRQTVRFSSAIQELLKDPNRILLEVGPGNALGTCVRQHLTGSHKRHVLTTVRHPLDRTSDLSFLLSTLGKLWLAGVEPDWKAFYKEERRRRVSLPTYPFERQRYWVEPAKPGSSGEGTRREAEKKSAIDDWFYLPSWKRADSGANAGSRSARFSDGPVLLFCDEQGLGEKLEQFLVEARQGVTVVRAGATFQRASEGSYTINPATKDDYRALWAELEASGRMPSTIMHLWCYTGGEAEFSDVDSYARFRTLGFNSLLFLTQAIASGPSGPSVQIKVVSNRLYEVTGEEILCPAKAIVLGPCRIAPQEHLNIRCATIDIGDGTIDHYARMLVNELAAGPVDTAIAYRGKHRWVQTFDRTNLAHVPTEALPVRPDGVYLITGGLGGVGLILAEHLASLTRVRLVLIGRTGLPAREQWSVWLRSHPDKDATSAKIREIQSIEARGSQVLMIQADVADRAGMQAALELARSRFGTIHGVIHAAGSRGDRNTMARKDAEEAASVLSAKVLGSIVLGELLPEGNLDFFVLCSSLSVQVGGIGSVDYSAANAFLDAYAQKYHSAMAVTSINWDGWHEVGMSASGEGPDYLKEKTARSMKFAMLPEEGIEAFDRILVSAHPQVIVSTRDLANTLQSAGIESVSNDTKERLPLASSHSRPALSSEYIAPGTSTEEVVADIWRELLGVANIGIHDNFFDLGGSSLLAPSMVGRVNRAFEVNLPVAALFENPTVHLLSQSIVRGGEQGPTLTESQRRGQQRRERVRR